MRRKRIAALFTLAAAVAAITGCEVDTHKNGDSKDVKISTPFGGLRVKTNDAVVLQDIGLPAYPGAEPVKKDKDNGSADVNMSFGSFQLRVKAATYRTGDSPEKVESFYRDGLRRFGTVIACKGNHAIGSPATTAEGLTCDNQKDNHFNVDVNSSKDKLELKAGSQQHQHVVEIENEVGGTKFGLIALDLPGKNFMDGDYKQDKQ